MEKPHIQYPCLWSYKIIGSDAALVREGIAVALEDFEVRYHDANRSRTGKYTALHLSVRVKNEMERKAIFDRLKNIPTVKVIL